MWQEGELMRPVPSMINAGGSSIVGATSTGMMMPPAGTFQPAVLTPTNHHHHPPPFDPFHIHQQHKESSEVIVGRAGQADGLLAQ